MKVINIMSHTPPYDLYWRGPRPNINWDTARGTWVGIWGYDWADLVGTEVLKIDGNIDYEVWQPDLRVDRIYSYKFASGLVHRLFPARQRKRMNGFRMQKYVVSPSIVSCLEKERREGTFILHLNGGDTEFSRYLLCNGPDCATVMEFLGSVARPVDDLFSPQRNVISKLFNINEFLKFKSVCARVDTVSCCNESSRKNLRHFFAVDVHLIPVGVDFDFWRRREDKSSVRRRLGIVNNRFVLLSSCRFNGLKQLDRMISVLANLDHEYDFQYIVTGHGERGYEQYLHRCGQNLIEKQKLKFVGYLPKDRLIDYYNAADLFVITSLSEGAPDAAKKALAVELPIFSTNTGYVAELLLKYNAGAVIGVRDYHEWESKLKQILTGMKVRSIDRQTVKSLLHWPNVARQYYDMYMELSHRYQSRYGSEGKA